MQNKRNNEVNAQIVGSIGNAHKCVVLNKYYSIILTQNTFTCIIYSGRGSEVSCAKTFLSAVLSTGVFLSRLKDHKTEYGTKQPNNESTELAACRGLPNPNIRQWKCCLV